jgi:hypothetical protein
VVSVLLRIVNVAAQMKCKESKSILLREIVSYMYDRCDQVVGELCIARCVTAVKTCYEISIVDVTRNKKHDT